jgi:hypothetical protein
VIISKRNCPGGLNSLVAAAVLAISAMVEPAVADVITSFSVGPDQALVYPTDLPTLPDEHTTFFPPVGPNSTTYLVFAAASISGGPAGTVALETSDLKTFTFASGYSNPVMVPPVHFTTCNPTYNTEFDENYSAPGSVLQDPTRSAGESHHDLRGGKPLPRRGVAVAVLCHRRIHPFGGWRPHLAGPGQQRVRQ